MRVQGRLPRSSVVLSYAPQLSVYQIHSWLLACCSHMDHLSMLSEQLTNSVSPVAHLDGLYGRYADQAILNPYPPRLDPPAPLLR